MEYPHTQVLLSADCQAPVVVVCTQIGHTHQCPGETPPWLSSTPHCPFPQVCAPVASILTSMTGGWLRGSGTRPARAALKNSCSMSLLTVPMHRLPM